MLNHLRGLHRHWVWKVLRRHSFQLGLVERGVDDEGSWKRLLMGSWFSLLTDYNVL